MQYKFSQKPNCPQCPDYLSRRHSPFKIASENNSALVYLTFWGDRKKPARNAQCCSYDKQPNRIYGNKVNFTATFVSLDSASARISSEMTVHVDYISAGHAFWHEVYPDCHDAGFSEIVFAEFCNWILLLVGQFATASLASIPVKPQEYEHLVRQLISNFIQKSADYFFSTLFIKQRWCDSALPTHKILTKDDFFSYLADSHTISEMIAKGASFNEITHFAISNTRNYMLHYKYHFGLAKNFDKGVILFSDIFSNEIYGRNIRL